MRQRSRFVCYVVQTKKPRQSEVFFQGLRLVTAEHTVLRQRKKYTRSGTNAQFQARILTFLSMDHVANFVHKILFIYSIYLYWGCSQCARGPQFTGATKSWLKRVVPSVP